MATVQNTRMTSQEREAMLERLACDSDRTFRAIHSYHAHMTPRFTFSGFVMRLGRLLGRRRRQRRRAAD